MPICHLCEAEIVFDPTKVSPRTGVMIPQSPNGVPHDCPAWERQHIKYYLCKKGCGSEIYFDKKMRTANGGWIPISKTTGFAHECGDKYH
jgi:hypothetical protein